MEKKVLTLNELETLTKNLQKKNKKLVLSHGCFDLLHLGHIRHFQEAKKQGDILIVTVTSDEFVNKGPDRPYFTHDHRAEAIAALTDVDFVAVNFAETPIDVIKTLKPSVYAKGPDYSDMTKDITGNIAREKEAIERVGGSLYITEDITFSSSALINTFLSEYSEEQKQLFTTIKQSYSPSDFDDFESNFSASSACLYYSYSY